MIVVGVDGSEPSKDALRWAARQAELTEAGLQVVITWSFPTTSGWEPSSYPSGIDYETDARKVLDDVVDEVLGAARPTNLTTSVVSGHPAQVLVEAAHDADLLVVGSRGHGMFAGMLLGSVSEHCVHQADCPVVIVRHPSHSDQADAP
ncbi:MAG: universal stress protein [Acidimicrobiales bacterium]